MEQVQPEARDARKEPEVVVNQPSPEGYKNIAIQYRHEILQSVNREKGKRKAVSDRIRSFAEICVFLSIHHPEKYLELINENPFAVQKRISWEELKSLR